MSGSKSNTRDILFVLAASWVVRALYITILPYGARSFDAFAWEKVSKLLNQGVNPYHATEFLSWPPLWMQLIFCISRAASFLHLPFFHCLQIFLIAIESIVIVQLYKLIRDVAPSANARNIVLIGISLNPIAILLVCQHCNFDVLVGLWVLLFARYLIQYQRTSDAGYWLGACLFLGLGILTKTVPLILIPLLASGFRQVPWLFKTIGAFLVLGPTTLGMSVVYVLAPDDIASKVLGYRGAATNPEYYGIPNLFLMAGADRFEFIHHFIFYALVALAIVTLWNLSWRQRIEEKELILIPALVLACIPTLGPGWGIQYIYWYLPLLVATWPLFSSLWRKVLAGFGLVAAVTYLVEYTTQAALGFSLLFFLDPTKPVGPYPPNLSPSTVAIFNKINDGSSSPLLTIMNLPIFIGYLILLLFGFRILFSAIPGILNFKVLKPYYFVVGAVCLVSISVSLAKNPAKNLNMLAKNQVTMPNDVAITPDEKLQAAISLNNMALNLAISPDKNVRNGKLAVALAHCACDLTNYRLPGMIGTLAAAYAEAGDFQEAATNAQRALDLATQLNVPTVADLNRKLLVLYKSNRPYHLETNSVAVDEPLGP